MPYNPRVTGLSRTVDSQVAPGSEDRLDPTCLQYALTEEERETFEREGYLIVEDALPAETVDSLIGTVDRCYRDNLLTDVVESTIKGYVAAPNFLAAAPAFFDLVDYERILPKVWGILGWNIFLYHSHLIITQQAPGVFDANGETFHWHQDSDRLNFDVETDPRPRLSLKVGYFLTDLTEAGRGNFWVIPGSHMRNTIELPPDGLGQPEGAIPVLVKPGTAVLFDRRMWHCGTTNYSPIVRKVLFYGYGYRWIRPRDQMTIPPEIYEAASPIRKQLLGHTTSEYGRSSPSDKDVPLRVWLGEHQPETAAR